MALKTIATIHGFQQSVTHMNIEERLNFAAISPQKLTDGFDTFVVDSAKLLESCEVSWRTPSMTLH